MHLHQTVADEQRADDAGANRLLVCARHDKPIDHRVHVLDVGGVEVGLVRDVDRLAIDDKRAAAFLADVGEDDIEVLAVQLEHRRAQLDLGSLGQGENRLENLARRAARRRLARTWTVRLADRREQQIQVAGDVRHRAHGRPWVVGDGLLLDRDHRGQTEDEVDVRLGDVRDESLGVARERLHVATLALGIDRVEGEARLAGS